MACRFRPLGAYAQDERFLAAERRRATRMLRAFLTQKRRELIARSSAKRPNRRSLRPAEARDNGTLSISNALPAEREETFLLRDDIADPSVVAARVDSGVRDGGPVSVAAFVEDAATVVAVLARERRTTLTVAEIDPNIVVNGDRRILVWVFASLLQNAMTLTPTGGQISLDVSVFTGRVELDVVAFSQPGKRSGFGPVLSIARRAVEAHGGELRLKDVPGRGCIFGVDLPAHLPGPW